MRTRVLFCFIVNISSSLLFSFVVSSDNVQTTTEEEEEVISFIKESEYHQFSFENLFDGKTSYSFLDSRELRKKSTGGSSGSSSGSSPTPSSGSSGVSPTPSSPSTPIYPTPSSPTPPSSPTTCNRNRICSGRENCNNCRFDCDRHDKECGDGKCVLGENCENCPEDCNGNLNDISVLPDQRFCCGFEDEFSPDDGCRDDRCDIDPYKCYNYICEGNPSLNSSSTIAMARLLFLLLPVLWYVILLW